MTDVSQIAREEGSKFEKQLYNTLKENLSDGFTIKQEKDIKREYGKDTCQKIKNLFFIFWQLNIINKKSLIFY
jgi:hypothetical protein